MKYSIIIPVYKCERYLEKCIKSIIKQNIQDMEIILVDDGSPDKSGFIADRIQEENLIVKTFHKLNGGAASARNFGLTKAQGEWILFIDGDDTLSEGSLKNINEMIDKNNVDIFIYGMSFDYYIGKQIQRVEQLSCKHSGCITVNSMNEEFHEYFIDNALSSACNKVFRRSIIIDNGIFFKEGMTLYEDFDFVLNYLRYCKYMFFINQPFYHYRLDLNNQHIHNRIKNLNKLSVNLKKLLTTMEVYTVKVDGTIDGNAVMTTGVNLSLQLLDQHLYHYGINELAINNYVQEVNMQEYVQKYHIVFGASEKRLYEQIRKHQFKMISSEIRKKQRKNALKRFVKKVIGRKL